MQAFISYNSKDGDIAKELALFLAAEGVGVWFDEWDVPPGSSISVGIETGLASCSHFLLLWSSNSAASEWVKRERAAALQLAIANGVPLVIPVRLDETPLPPLLADLKHLKFEAGSKESLRTIVAAVLGHDPGAEFVQAIVRKYHEVLHDPDGAMAHGLAVCPRCGSGDIVEDDEADVDYGSDGSAQSCTFIPAIRCRSCRLWTRIHDLP